MLTEFIPFRQMHVIFDPHSWSRLLKNFNSTLRMCWDMLCKLTVIMTSWFHAEICGKTYDVWKMYVGKTFRGEIHILASKLGSLGLLLWRWNVLMLPSRRCILASNRVDWYAIICGQRVLGVSCTRTCSRGKKKKKQNKNCVWVKKRTVALLYG